MAEGMVVYEEFFAFRLVVEDGRCSGVISWDLMNGGVGLDYLYGGNDDDTFYTRDSTFDLLSGGPGNDTAQSETEDTRDTIEILLA